MKTYDLHLDSGPKMKKTYVHVPALLGCMARGDTTEIAVADAPDAIRAYLRFMARHGERVDPQAPLRVRVAHHVTDNAWSGMGGGFLPTDEQPLTKRETKVLLARLAGLHADLRRLTGTLKPAQLDRTPAKGRAIRRILSHICVEGVYLREVPGASRLQRLADEGKLDANDALDQLLPLERARLAGMTDAQRAEVIMRGQSPWSARSAVRRMLEHGWEHYTEIAARLGAPP